MSHNGSTRYTLHDEVPKDVARLVDAGLETANAAAAPLHEVRGLACAARSPDGEIIGGAIGRTWGRCCEVQQLWVHPDHRRQGIGAQLMRELHRRAEERGCRVFYLETFSFQAPRLYQALGYRIQAELAGFAEGIVKYFMVREAANTASLEG